MTPTTVYVCVTCRRAGESTETANPGAQLADATAAALALDTLISVQRVRCLANCSRGLSAAIARDGAWTYVFGGLDAARDGEALAAGARLLAAAGDGLLPWINRPEPLKRGLIARVPPSVLSE